MNSSPTSQQPTTVIGVPLILLLAALTALDAMAIDLYLPGMPLIADDFGVTSGVIQQTLAVFLAGLAVGQGIYGPLLDRFGRRIPLLIGAGIFVVGSIMAALAPTVEWLLVARLVQALGAAAGLVAPRAIVDDLCSMAESAHVFSLLMQVMMIAPILAPILGGYLLGYGSWRLIFWVMAGVGLAVLFWALRTIPDSLPADRRVPLNLGNILGAYGRQMRNSVFMAYTVAGGFILGSLFVYISASSFVFSKQFGLSPTQFSYVFAANSIAFVVGGHISNRLLKRGAAAGTIMLRGIVLHMVAGLTLFLVTQTSDTSLTVYSGLLAVALGALGLVFGNLTALTMMHAGQQAGVASALMGMLHYLTAAIIGYAVSFMPQGLGQLPLAIACCGAFALLLCHSAARLAALHSHPQT